MGSLPGRLFDDGSVCLGEASTPAQCQTILLTLPAEIVTQKDLTLYGIFDVDNDGDPEVFLGYSQDFETTLLVYKKIGPVYQPYLTLHDPDSGGFSPGTLRGPEAWCLAESPMGKVIFRTGCCQVGTGALFSRFPEAHAPRPPGSQAVERVAEARESIGVA